MQDKEFFNKLLDMYVEAYGKDAEINICIEEMSELMKALSKYIRYENYLKKYPNEERLIKLEEIKKNIIEECADVMICVSQIKRIFGEREVENIIDMKNQRGFKQVKADLESINIHSISGSEE